MLGRSETFELTEAHITLLRASGVSARLSDREYGAAAIDPKRPYGNGDVEPDIAKLLGIEVGHDGELSESDRKRCRELHAQTPTALQIVLATGTFQPGLYVKTNCYDRTSWRLGNPKPNFDDATLDIPAWERGESDVDDQPR